MQTAFDNDKYIRIQSEHIRERIAQFDNKLYLELGGKLFDDMHASRVLPGFMPDSKLRMLTQLRDSLEILIVLSAEDIERNKVRQDLGITYDEDVLRLREEFINRGFMVSSVVITHYSGQRSADAYRQRLERKGIRVQRESQVKIIAENTFRLFRERGHRRYEKRDYTKQTEQPSEHRQKPFQHIDVTNTKFTIRRRCFQIIHHPQRQTRSPGHSHSGRYTPLPEEAGFSWWQCRLQSAHGCSDMP